MEIFKKYLTRGKRVFSDMTETNPVAEGIPAIRDNSAKAWLPIMYGCDNFCTYCVVPYVRGRERSRKSADIIAEFKQIVAEGYKDITLLGQNVNSYGKGLDEDINFSKLIRKLNDVPGDFTIRFMTSHPKDCTKELIDTIAECEKAFIDQGFKKASINNIAEVVKAEGNFYTTNGLDISFFWT